MCRNMADIIVIDVKIIAKIVISFAIVDGNQILKINPYPANVDNMASSYQC